ncbi:MAG: magnesium/cobalt transporter CorA [Bacteroidota bacterium]
MNSKKYLDYIINPLELLRTKEVLKVNPTIIPERKEITESKIYLFEYNNESITSSTIKNIEDCYKHLETTENTWINIDGIKKDDVEKICFHFGVHPLIIEDILSVSQRPKMDQINGLLFCVLDMLYFNEKESAVEAEQISIVLGRNFVISFQEDEKRDVFNSLREKMKINGSKIRQSGADFLYYSLIDSIVDHYYLVMEKLGGKIEQLEEDIIRNSSNRTLVNINNLRKEMILLKRSIGPVRELIHGILRSENEIIEEKTEKYFKDVYDHIVQANDLAENYRDIMINIHDLYMSNMNLKLNEAMKVMAIVTCMLAPATVIGGIFGMNFERLPLLHNKWGFFVSVGLMILIPAWMMLYFKKKKWF